MLYDLVILEEHRVKMESQLAEAKELQRGLKVQLERHQRDEIEYNGRLKYGPSMADSEVQTLTTRLETAKKGTLDVGAKYTQSEAAAGTLGWTLNEITAEIDTIFLDFKNRFGHLVGPGAASLASNIRNGGDHAKEETLADDVELEVANGNVKRLSESKKVSSLREGVTRLVEHFSELTGLKLFVHDPLATDVPHFSAWEQRTQTTIFTAKEKIERTQRYCGNVLNAISSTYPSLAKDVPHWTLLVGLVDDALRRVTLRNVQNALHSYSGCFQGMSARELFAINLKLGANCRVSFVPLATEISNLVNGVVTKVLNVGTERYIGDMISAVASPPGSAPAAGGVAEKGASPFIKGHLEFISTDDEVSSYVTAIKTSTAMFSDDIVNFVVNVERQFEYLWGPEMTALNESSLLSGMDQIQAWNPEQSLGKGAVLINAFPLQDAVVSMCQAQLQRLRKQAADKNCDPRAIEGRMRSSTLADCAHAPWVTEKTKAAPMPVKAHEKDAIVPTTRVAAPTNKVVAPTNRVPVPTTRVPPLKTNTPKAAEASSTTTPGASPTSAAASARGVDRTQTNASSSARKSSVSSSVETPRLSNQATPRQQGARNATALPSMHEGSSREGSLNSSAMLSGRSTTSSKTATTPQQHTNSNQGAPPAAQYTNTTPQDSPRPSTTPVGTRSRQGSVTGHQPTPTQSLTPQKYQGPASLRNEGSVYARALGLASTHGGGSSGNGTPTQNSSGIGARQLSPTAPQPAAAYGTKSVEVLKPTGGRSLESTPSRSGAGVASPSSHSVPEVQPLGGSSTKKNAWGTPNKKVATTEQPQEDAPKMTQSLAVGGGSTGGLSPLKPASPRRPGPTKEEDEVEIQRMLKKEQDTLRRIGELNGREEQRRAHQEEGRSPAHSPPKPSAKEMYLAEKEKQEKIERQAASRDAQQKRDRDETTRLAQQAESVRRRRESEIAEEKVVAAKREAENRRKQQEMEDRLETEMRRREAVQKKVLDERRREEERLQRKREETRLAQERSELQRLEKQQAAEEAAQAAVMVDYQKKMSKINEETSALRKKLQLPPVQPPNQRVPAEATSPSPIRSGRNSSGTATAPDGARPLPSTTPNNKTTSLGRPGSAGGPYTLPQRPASTTKAMNISPLPFTDDGVERSLLDDYRRCCQAAGIKPNSGLLKKLPKEIGEHIIDINLDLNYIGVKGVQPLIHILKKNRGLRLLNLKDNNLENNEVRQLVSVLLAESGDFLEVIDLSNNPISLAGGSALLDLVTAKRTLKTVHLKGTLIQPRVVERIVEAATENGKALAREQAMGHVAGPGSTVSHQHQSPSKMSPSKLRY